MKVFVLTTQPYGKLHGIYATLERAEIAAESLEITQGIDSNGDEVYGFGFDIEEIEVIE
jgi:hypothetical protein